MDTAGKTEQNIGYLGIFKEKLSYKKHKTMHTFIKKRHFWTT